MQKVVINGGDVDNLEKLDWVPSDLRIKLYHGSSVVVRLVICFQGSIRFAFFHAFSGVDISIFANAHIQKLMQGIG